MEPILSQDVQEWFELILLWTGFGTCVGLLAKALMPGRDPGGAVATLLMGITGVIIGCGVYTLVYDEKISPVTPVGLVCGTLGAFVILLFYRVLGGYLLDEDGSARRLGDRLAKRLPHQLTPRLRRRRRHHTYDLDDEGGGF